MKLRQYIHKTVTQDGWSASLTMGTGINGAILNVTRFRLCGRELPFKKWMPGHGDGKLFPTSDAAWQWAFDHGYIRLYFTDSDLRARAKSRGAEMYAPGSSLRTDHPRYLSLVGKKRVAEGQPCAKCGTVVNVLRVKKDGDLCLKCDPYRTN